MEGSDLLTQIMQYLITVLPGALVAKAGGFGAVTIAIVQFLRKLPQFEERKKIAAPAASLVIGQLFGWVAVGFQTSQAGVATGLGVLIFLIAVGGHSTYKNILQQLQQEKQPGQKTGAA